MRRGDQQVADRVRGKAPLDEIAQGVEVAQRLGHLLAVHEQVLGVHPKARERPARGALRLRDLVLVVRELQVHAPGVDVKGLAEVCHRHGRALQVPAGAARAERAVPARLAVTARLPQHEVAGVILAVLVGVHPRAGQDAARIEPRELAVIVQAGDAEVGRAAGLVGMAGLRDAPDQLDHLRNVVRRRGHDFGPLQAEQLAVLEERVDVLLGVLADRHASRRRGGDDLVLDIGDVHHMPQLPAALPHVPPQDVLERKRAQVSDVDEVVNGWAARVYAGAVAFGGLERLHLAAEAVIQLECH